MSLVTDYVSAQGTVGEIFGTERRIYRMFTSWTCGKTWGRIAAVAILSGTLSVARGADDKHEHPEKGPHKGDLIELGDEEYHAEFIHDDEKCTVTVYILDGAAKSVVPTDTKEAVINLKQKGKPLQFKLKATPQSTDPKGTSSRFASQDKNLCEVLEDEKSDPRLRVTIKGKSYTGKIVHHHDHDHEKKK